MPFRVWHTKHIWSGTYLYCDSKKSGTNNAFNLYGWNGWTCTQFYYQSKQMLEHYFHQRIDMKKRYDEWIMQQAGCGMSWEKEKKYNRIKKTPKWNFYSCRIVPFAGKFNFRMNISRTSRVEFSYQWLMFFFQFERWAPCRCNIQRVKVYKSSFHWACVYLSGSCWARYVFFPILFVVEAKRSSIYRWLYHYYVFFSVAVATGSMLSSVWWW